MRIENTENQSLTTRKLHSGNTSNTLDFFQILKKQSLSSQKIDTLIVSNKTLPDKLADNSVNSMATNTIKLGELTEKNTTVAHLLLHNTELKPKTWSIIHDPINQAKSFQKIPSGSQVFYNQSTREVSWRQPNSIEKPITSRQKSLQVEKEITDKSSPDKKIVLGTINKESPTISNLLQHNHEYRSQRWNIIHSEINKHKPFTQIPNGATVFLDAITKELSWTTTSQKSSFNVSKGALSVDPTQQKNNANILSRRLDEAVKPYMGTDYKQIDCYTLVVQGLKDMGVTYNGRGGLSRQLLQMAHAEGRANNAYFTGEGITEAMGKKIYTKAINRVKDIDQQSRDIYKEMQHLMQKGDILSFSLESKGHTGVISQNKDQWTYINSGRLDNSINQSAPENGVGEETLQDEINNWVKRAHNRNESLQITIGRLDSQKMV